ncbi:MULTISPECIES: hypothetical protein [unclassified Streptomyces]|uniref:hypothetical protein n=1 Tax=unclassified Streptomyces TaxID=2593676 RepID=UPI0035E21A44
MTTYTRAQVRRALNQGADMAAEESGRSPYDRRFHRAVNTAITLLTTPAATWRDVEECYSQTAEQTREAERRDTRAYSHDEVATAVNDGIDQAAEYNGREHPDDLDHFLGNAALTLLDDPDVTFEDIVETCYDTEPDEVRSWL